MKPVNPSESGLSRTEPTRAPQYKLGSKRTALRTASIPFGFPFQRSSGSWCCSFWGQAIEAAEKALRELVFLWMDSV